MVEKFLLTFFVTQLQGGQHKVTHRCVWIPWMDGFQKVFVLRDYKVLQRKKDKKMTPYICQNAKSSYLSWLADSRTEQSNLL